MGRGIHRARWLGSRARGYPRSMTADDATQDDTAALVYLTVDLDGQWWWAQRDDDGELTKSDGPYPDRVTCEDRARDALTPDPPSPPDVTFEVEEDQRVAEAPSA